MKHSIHSIAIVRLFLDQPEKEWYGYEISQEISIKAGTLYPILNRLEKMKWLMKRKEDINPKVQQRAARIFYRLSEDGKKDSEVWIAQFKAFDLLSSPQDMPIQEVVPIKLDSERYATAIKDFLNEVKLQSGARVCDRIPPRALDQFAIAIFEGVTHYWKAKEAQGYRVHWDSAALTEQRSRASKVK